MKVYSVTWKYEGIISLWLTKAQAEAEMTRLVAIPEGEEKGEYSSDMLVIERYKVQNMPELFTLLDEVVEVLSSRESIMDGDGDERNDDLVIDLKHKVMDFIMNNQL